MPEWLVKPVMTPLAERDQVEFSAICRITVDMMNG